MVDEVKLRVLYVPPPQPPSPVPEGSEEGSSPRPSLSDNGNLNASELLAVSIYAIRLFICLHTHTHIVFTHIVILI